jgi:hypothetical protein
MMQSKLVGVSSSQCNSEKNLWFNKIRMTTLVKICETSNTGINTIEFHIQGHTRKEAYKARDDRNKEGWLYRKRQT